MELNTPLNCIFLGDALKRLRKLPDNSVNCIITSPPYWGLRDYGVKGQLGMEATPEAYVRRLVKIFREARRVLKHDGTLWLNLGDSYAAAGKKRSDEQAARKSTLVGSKGTQISCKNQIKKTGKGLKPKDLVGIPWMVAFAMRNDGWWLRQEVIWNKPNPMPESVTDRCTRAHENIFMFSKSNKYYYDYEAIKTPAKNPLDDIRRVNTQHEDAKSIATDNKNGLRVRTDKQRGHSRRHAGFNQRWDNMSTAEQMSMGANKRSVWTVATMPFTEAHFAVYPEELIVDAIKAGCPEGGTVLDPFFGAGTTGLVSKKLNRNYIGIELNPQYVEIAKKRLHNELGLFH